MKLKPLLALGALLLLCAAWGSRRWFLSDTSFIPLNADGIRLPVKLHDNGDGTYATAVYVQGSLSSGQTQFSILDSQFGAMVSHASKPSAGTLGSITVQSVDSNPVYLQVFNSASAPTGGATPIFSWLVGSGNSAAPTYRSVGISELGILGVSMSTGISWGLSSTNSTYTATTDSASNFNVTVVGS